jgi:hypothetical protein
MKNSQALVAHACNLSYSGVQEQENWIPEQPGRVWETPSSANSSWCASVIPSYVGG